MHAGSQRVRIVTTTCLQGRLVRKSLVSSSASGYWPSVCVCVCVCACVCALPCSAWPSPQPSWCPTSLLAPRHLPSGLPCCPGPPAAVRCVPCPFTAVIASAFFCMVSRSFPPRRRPSPSSHPHCTCLLSWAASRTFSLRCSRLPCAYFGGTSPPCVPGLGMGPVPPSPPCLEPVRAAPQSTPVAWWLRCATAP